MVELKSHKLGPCTVDVETTSCTDTCLNHADVERLQLHGPWDLHLEPLAPCTVDAVTSTYADVARLLRVMLDGMNKDTYCVPEASSSAGTSYPSGFMGPRSYVANCHKSRNTAWLREAETTVLVS